MDFEQSVEYLLSLGHETLAIKLGLRNTELLLEALDNPQRAFPSVQIAGTNGKGSTAVMLDSICRAAGIKTGLYTSPHLVSMTERIKVSGVEITTGDFAACATVVREVSEQLEALPTFFEQMTAIALLAFRNARVKLAILETGLGGRLDSTTAANARIVAITSIAFDHEEYLGHTIESIAVEKAAIIRPGVRAVIGRQPESAALDVLLKRCEQVGVMPILAGSNAGEMALGLRGRHQVDNAAVAIGLAELLNDEGFEISRSAIV
ncbi:MAG TPA: Mur ligase family protein, partial [Pyrinomonadaceae bacterium]|nr:Mur ligase family protein [Pyrinomonadaceae bacterium]